MGRVSTYTGAVRAAARILDEQTVAESRGWELAQLCHRWTVAHGESGNGRVYPSAAAAGKVTAATFAADLDRPRFGAHAVKLYRKAWERYGDPSKRLRWSDGSELTFGDHLAALGLSTEKLFPLIEAAERDGLTLASARSLLLASQRVEREAAAAPVEVKALRIRRELTEPGAVDAIAPTLDTATAAALASRLLDSPEVRATVGVDRLVKAATSTPLDVDGVDRVRNSQREEKERDAAVVGSPMGGLAWAQFSQTVNRATYLLRAIAEELHRRPLTDEQRTELWPAYRDRLGRGLDLVDMAAAGRAFTDSDLRALLGGE